MNGLWFLLENLLKILSWWHPFLINMMKSAKRITVSNSVQEMLPWMKAKNLAIPIIWEEEVKNFYELKKFLMVT